MCKYILMAFRPSGTITRSKTFEFILRNTAEMIRSVSLFLFSFNFSTPIAQVQPDVTDPNLISLEREFADVESDNINLLQQLEQKFEKEKEMYEQKYRLAQEQLDIAEKKCAVLDVLQAENDQLRLKLKSVEELVKL